MLVTRRQILKAASTGFGYLAFAGLAAAEHERTNGPLAVKPPHFAAKAKRVIFLCMSGGPSHVDTFDYKPALNRDHGKKGKYGGNLLKSPWKFQQRGESGLWISDLFPEVARHADELALIRSMACDQPVHTGALTQMHTGSVQFIRPSLGAWTLYGLGSENASLPGFVSLGAPPSGGSHLGSAFLPAVFGGTQVGSRNRFSGRAPSASVPDIRNPRLTRPQQRQQLDLIQQLNRQQIAEDSANAEVEAVIESYELAFRMQDSLPTVMDLKDETADTLRHYGIDGGPSDAFGKQCLLARRFVEAGVRFVEITHGGWDQHTDLTDRHQAQADACDRPIAGLLSDLKQRDMLRDTLVIWGGEFGRTPAAQGGDGRNHNNQGYTTWMAGGGIRGGLSYGATDEHGYEAVEDKCPIHDWHATILHLMGLDHQRLTYRYAGRDFRLTDVYGKVVERILA